MRLYPCVVKQSETGFGKSMLRSLGTMLLVDCLFLFIFAPHASAQYYTRWSLPEGAKARLGKGEITGNIVYSPDGTRLAVASSIGIWLYETQTYQEVALLTGHTATLKSVAFSPDGKTLASGGGFSRQYRPTVGCSHWSTQTHPHRAYGPGSIV